jgi:hypothetical protein
MQNHSWPDPQYSRLALIPLLVSTNSYSTSYLSYGINALNNSGLGIYTERM